MIKTFSKKIYFIFALYFLVFGLFVAAISSFINYKASFVDINNKLERLADSEAEIKRESLHNHIHQIEGIVQSISHNDLTITYIKHPTELGRKNLNKLFSALASANKSVMQLRYINADGQEVIRIDRDKKREGLIVIPPASLQNKKDRYYFKEASLILPNQFYHSNIDLNIEGGKVEMPIKPTFRVATPVIVNNKFNGIIIVNILADDMITDLTTSANFEIYLCDKDGEIIHNPDKKNSWSKYLPDKNKLHDIYPSHAKSITRETTYNGTDVYAFTASSMLKNHENMKIILASKSGIVKEMMHRNLISALLIALTVLIVSIPLSALISIIPSRLQSKLTTAYDEIKQNAAIIDKHVMYTRTDPKGIITEVSTCFSNVTEYSKQELIGRKHSYLAHPTTSPETYQNLWTTISKGKIWNGELKDIKKNKEDIWINQVITPEFSEPDVISGYTSISHDITDKKVIEKMSMTDRLTGLYNRHKFDKIISREASRTARYKSTFSIIIFDIDFFKKVNDTHGHQVGDDVLIRLADILRNSVRETDLVSRWGGEEFIIIASSTELADTLIFAEKIRKIVETSKFPVVKQITISCGVAEFLPGESTSELISRADNALYKAKDSGRNKVVSG